MKTYEDYLEEEGYERHPFGSTYEEYNQIMEEHEAKMIDYTKELEVYNIDNLEVGYKVNSTHPLKGWVGDHCVVWENGGFEYANNFNKFGVPCSQNIDYRVRNKPFEVVKKYSGFIIVDKEEAVFSTRQQAEMVLRNYMYPHDSQVVYVEDLG